ncbi:hypothetical protein J0H58_28820 [bacterium]|nr:hypothetical protein [bacterium]
MPDPTPSAPPTCARCRLWVRGDAVSGQCKARPPVPHPEPPPGPAGRFGVWPLTLAQDWCGGFVPRGAAGC